MQATKGFSSSDWCKSFVVEFKGEEGLDWGGVSRELFQLLCTSCFNCTNGMFRRFKDSPQALVSPHHMPTSNPTPIATCVPVALQHESLLCSCKVLCARDAIASTHVTTEGATFNSWPQLLCEGLCCTYRSTLTLTTQLVFLYDTMNLQAMWLASVSMRVPSATDSLSRPDSPGLS